MKKSNELRVIASVMESLEHSMDSAYRNMEIYCQHYHEAEEKQEDTSYWEQEADYCRYMVEVYNKLIDTLAKGIK